MKRVFISDLHLDDTRPDLTRAFFRFLDERVRDADQLFILGDLFEVWLGDDDDRAVSRLIVMQLATVAADVFVMHGNRDFLLGERFCQQASVHLLADPWLLDTEAGQILLMHGDSLCTKDTAYINARSQLRSADFQQDFLSKPLAERAAIATELRGQSKTHTRETAADIMDVTPEEVVRVMQEAQVDVLIHGHTHRPAEHQLTLDDRPARRLVLGDWNTSARYAEMNDGDLQLLNYDC
ncbi:MAG: UDP-2,3-diacylglucosamine diphosphatase [Pseudomonadales bacterium]